MLRTSGARAFGLVGFIAFYLLQALSLVGGVILAFNLCHTWTARICAGLVLGPLFLGLSPLLLLYALRIAFAKGLPGALRDIASGLLLLYWIVHLLPLPIGWAFWTLLAGSVGLLIMGAAELGNALYSKLSGCKDRSARRRERVPGA
jgi:hypothetical protein